MTREEREVREELAGRVRAFGRSLHIRHVDAGSCGACESEVQALQNPFYDLHRVGLFFTPSPRHADLLLVTGPVTRAMERPLKMAYEAMPDPKVVIAACGPACGGGIYGRSYATLGGVDAVLPVDVYVPGSPPHPLSLLHGILLALGRIEQKIGREEHVAGRVS
ncbi:NADH-quinone oxidoreductase subunit B family protein [Rubrobacter calidifluminis]|uniref:NADH-quinone oxidoreductase subunit B family protein n=1 Tax=Rubrobacter calidifluminis TaxID=1392640 RepID=UPI0023603766|nr:NADH-quinone oxidoreductase subunit B family protein [Rubrobacter calidifluminis]